MTAVFLAFALLTVAGAVAALNLRNLVHCVLALVVAFGGLAAIYLQLGAQFIGFAQVLVYIGAVAILIVFAILLTRGAVNGPRPLGLSSWISAAGTAGVLFAVVAGAAVSSKALPRGATAEPPATVRQIGDLLMTHYVLPLEVVGLLLTAALIGATIIAMPEGRSHRDGLPAPKAGQLPEPTPPSSHAKRAPSEEVHSEAAR